MAPRKTDPVVVSEKQGSIEIAYVKLAGNDATLQDAVRAFTALINRPSSNGHVLSSAKQVNALPAKAVAATSDGQDPVDATQQESIDVEPADDPSNDVAPAATPRAPRKYTLPTAMPIDTEGGMSVDAYIKQYTLGSNEEKYLALAGWLKAHRDQMPLKAGLIVTLFKHLDWPLPGDVTMPFRRLVSKQWQWLDRTSNGEYQIHQVGESKLAKLKA